jgi:hypothetical protein
MIRFDLKYAEELKRDTERIKENWEINYTIKENNILSMKEGYREMARFNQSYSEIGFNEDIMNLQIYEELMRKGDRDED